MAITHRARSGDAVGGSKHQRESLWTDAWRRLVRNRAAVIGMSIIVILVLTAILAPQIAPQGFADQAREDHDKVPEWTTQLFPTMAGYARISDKYLLGADYAGRDLFSRMVYGTRISLAVAFVGPLISLLIGVTYGSISGFLGGQVDELMMRCVDVMYAFPGLLLIILLMFFFRSTFSNAEPGTLGYALNAMDAHFGGMLFIFIGIGFTAWDGMARLTRAQVLSVREKEFIEAARTVGASDVRIMFRHILPNIVGPLVVTETLSIPGYTSTEAFLSFIGLGVNPPTHRGAR